MKRFFALCLAASAVTAVAQGGPSVNENTGDLSYVYPFNLPPARGRHQPALALVYSSASRANRGYGFGWELTAFYVEREVRFTPASSQDPVYVLVLGQRREIIIRAPNGTWATEVQREPLEIQAVSGGSGLQRWEITDPAGTKLTFSTACGERWYLSEAVDLDGNKVVYNHECQAGPSVMAGLTSILYDKLADSEAATSYARRIVLESEPTTTAGTENAGGVLVDQTRRLTRVRIEGPLIGTTRKALRSFELQYTQGPGETALGPSATLERIVEWGLEDAQALPPTVFSYQVAAGLTLGAETGTAAPLEETASWEWLDVDGDGITDLKVGSSWARSTWNGSTLTFGPMQPILRDESGIEFPGVLQGQFMDFDGDGVLDFVHPKPSTALQLNPDTGEWFRECTRSGDILVRFGKRLAGSLAFADADRACIDRSLVEGLHETNGLCLDLHELTCRQHLLLDDFNGDGVKDYAVRAMSGAWQVYTAVKLGGVCGSDCWQFRSAGAYAEVPGVTTVEGLLEPLDVNGDGFLDAVANASDDSTGHYWPDVWPVYPSPNATRLGAWPGSWQATSEVTHGPSTLPPHHNLVVAPGVLVAAERVNPEGSPEFPHVGEACTTLVTDPRADYWARLDVNGDGVVDFVRSADHAEGYLRPGGSIKDPVATPYSGGQLRVSFGTGRGHLGDVPVACPGGQPCTFPPGGDRAPVYQGKGVVLSAPPVVPAGDWGNYECAGEVEWASDGTHARLIDVNGDGILDYVSKPEPPALGLRVRLGSLGGVAVPRPWLLAGVTSPMGAVTTVTYASSRAFGDRGGTRPVVTAVTVSGPNLEPRTTRFWYEAGADEKYTLAYDAGRPDDRGFATSWSWVDDVATRWARKTTWVRASYAAKGSASLVEEGPITSLVGVAPPTFTVSRRVATTFGVKQVGQSACSPTEAYPAQVIPLEVTTSTFLDDGVGGRAAAGTIVATACEDVNANGLVLKTTKRAFSQNPGGTRYFGNTLETRTVLTGGAPTACKALERVVTVEAKDLASGIVLSRDVAEYDDHCRKTKEYAQLDGGEQRRLKTWTYRPLGTGTAAWFGLPVSTTAVGVTTTFDYGATSPVPFLYSWAETTSDGSSRALRTERTLDPEAGWKLSETGPIVLLDGAPIATIPRITRFYLYDALGRTLAIAKQPFGEAGGAANRLPRATHANQVVEAHEFDDASSPRWAKSYKFAVPRSYAIDPGTGAQAIPATDDVMLSVSFLDELGREIQVRERLGTGAAGPGGDTAAGGFVRSSPALTGWRVAKSVWFDRAGRAAVSWEPHDVAGGGFSHPRDGASIGTRATVTAFDAEGRPWCGSTRYVASGVPAAPATCTSDSSHTASFKMSIETRYRARQLAGRGPFGGWFVETITVPPDLNVPGRSGAVSALSGPEGEALGSIDADGRKTWVEHDLLGREIASWREGGSPLVATPNPGTGWGFQRTQSSPQAASWVTYDAAGLPRDSWDANAPTVVRQTRYDVHGRVSIVYPNVARTSEYVAYTYGELGRVTRVDEVTASGTRSTTSRYDVPYTGTPAEYGYTAGKLTWTAVDRGGTSETTVAYGFDDAGRLTRRDQWFAKLDNTRRFTVSSTYGGDGRVLDSKLQSAYHPAANPYFQYEVHFDPAGRPVDILGKSAAWGTNPAMESLYKASGYDALGRPALMKADVDRAVSARVYSPYSGRLTAECKKLGAAITCGSTSPGTTDIYRTDFSDATYEGTKLKSFKEYVGSTSNTTTYTTSYLPSGRISSTTAVKGGTAQAQTQDYAETFTYDGIGNIASVVNDRNTTITGRTAVRRNEAYTPTPGGQSGTVTDRLKKIADTGTAVGKSALEVRYGYDLANRLVSVTRTAGSSETLDYGPSGELSHRRVDGKDIFYVGEYATVTASYCAADCKATAAVNSVAVDAHLIYAGTRIASTRATSPDSQTAGRTLYYYRTRLGNVIGTSLRGGTAGAFYRYTPYGEIDLTNENDPGKETARSELGYTNALRLSGSLIHLVNRAYDPETKVFVQADVVDRLRYAYTGGDPTNHVDPAGLLAIRAVELNSNVGTNGTLSDYLRVSQKQVDKNDKAAKAQATTGTTQPTAKTEDTAQSGTQGTGASDEGKETQEKSKATQPRGNDTRLQQLTEFADAASKAARNHQITHLEALARTVEHAAGLYEGDKDAFVHALGLVVAGVDSTNLSKGDSTPLSDGFGQTGFAPQFQEPQWGDMNNQTRHFTAFVVAGYAWGGWPGGSGAFAASVANVMREVTGGAAGSIADALLGQMGVGLGYALHLDVITPAASGNWIRTNVGITP